MGKKRNTNKVTLALPLTTTTGGKGGSLCGREAGRENMSDASDLESIYSASVVGADFGEIDDENDVSNLVDSFGDQIENAQDKRIEIRLKAIDNMLLVLDKNFIPDQVEKYRGTIVDIIERNLKRTPEEALRVCSLAALFSIQLGIDFEEEICTLTGILRQICADESVGEEVRSACAQTLGICFYLSVESCGHKLECMQTLKNVWSGMKTAKVTGTSLFSSALGAWALLVEKCDPGYVLNQIDEIQPKICTFLDSATVEARISAGEALAILHEFCIKNIDDNFHFRNQNHLIGLLGEMAADSSKNHAKRDKKLQKMTFRQIIDAICNQNWPKLCVQFNKREQLELEGCHAKLLYDSLRNLLRSNLNMHLTNNEVLRELFDLGAVLEAEDPSSRPNKAHKNERLIQFGEQKKQMNINRSKGRAKKNDLKHDFGGD